MITVVGGTGRLGRLVCALLVSDGLPVRVVARRRPSTAVPGAEFVAADVRAPSALRTSLAGSAVVVSSMHGLDPNGDGSPATVDGGGNRNLIAAARAVGADIVLVSIIGARADHPVELFRMKAAAEAMIREEGAASRWTIIRGAAFVELWLDVFRMTAGRSGVPKVMGPGRNPMSFVSVNDVAVAVARAVTDPTLRGCTIEVATGELTLTDVAAFVTAPGKEPVHVPTPVVWSLGHVLRPFRPGLARLARQALAMEHVPMCTDGAPAHSEFPWLPHTPLLDVVRASRF